MLVYLIFLFMATILLSLIFLLEKQNGKIEEKLKEKEDYLLTEEKQLSDCSNEQISLIFGHYCNGRNIVKRNN